MEIFLPGLAVLLLIALVVFLILPRFGAPVLAVLSLLLLIYGVQNHMTMFYSEYRFSTWQEQLKANAPFVIIGAMILGLLGYMGFLFGSGAGNTLPVSNVPAINGVVNATVASNATTTGAAGVVNAITNTINSATKAVNGSGKSNSGLLTNLGRILNTPANNRRNNKAFLV